MVAAGVVAPLCVWKMAPPPWVPLVAVAWLPEKVLFSTKRRPPSLAIAPPAGARLPASVLWVMVSHAPGSTRTAPPAVAALPPVSFRLCSVSPAPPCTVKWRLASPPESVTS